MSILSMCRKTASLIYILYLSGALSPAITMPANAVELEICAHQEGFQEKTLPADLKAIKNGLAISIKLQQMEDNCYQATLPTCDSDVTIQAKVDRTFFGSSECSIDPSPMQIAMIANKIEILTASFGDPDDLNLKDFDTQGFILKIKHADEALEKFSEDGVKSVNSVYAALVARDYGTAQKEAAQVAALLLEAGEEGPSLAYSSITYAAGFRAIGLDAFAPENPLVVAGPTDTTIVMNEEGRRVLDLYQDARSINSKRGVWDFATTSKISEIEPIRAGEKLDIPTSIMDAGAVTPNSLSKSDFFIDKSGRLILK